MSSQKSISKLAVLGQPVGHSLSPLIHQHFASQHQRVIDYQKIDIESEADFMALIERSADEYVGFNVTVPYKQCLLAYAHENSHSCTLSSMASQAGAANTIAYHHPHKNSHTIANTDGQGFLNHLERLAVDIRHKKILMIGAGGASMGLLAQLTDHHYSVFSIYLCNRTAQKAQDLADKFAISYWQGEKNHTMQFDLIVNATAQGLDGSAYENPYFSERNVHSETYFYDLFYHKSQRTPFLNYVAEHYPQHQFSDGLGMLIEQAALSYRLWFGEMPKTDELYSSMRL